MTPAILALFVFPVALYLALAALPSGRPALVGLVASGVLAVLAAVGLAAVDRSGLGLAMAVLSIAASALAALVQSVRRVLGPGRAAWLYPMVVVAVLVAGGLPVILNLGA